jgi:anti-sigma factor RsiW
VTEAGELNCRELVEIVTNYLEDALSTEDRARFDAHLEDCEGCAAHLRQMRTTIGVLGSLSEDDIPSTAREALLRAFRDWKRG